MEVIAHRRFPVSSGAEGQLCRWYISRMQTYIAYTSISCMPHVELSVIEPTDDAYYTRRTTCTD